MNASIPVSKTEFDFGQASPTDVIEFEFDYNDHPDSIHYLEKSCGCTSAYFEDGKIKGVLDLNKTGNYSSGETNVVKWVTIYLNDGEDRFIADDKKRKIINPNKGTIKLSIRGRVVV